MNAIAWTVAQSRRLDLPCGAGVRSNIPIGLDAADRCAQWVVSTSRRVSWRDCVEHFGWNRFHAMRLLRTAAERGLLVRIPSHHRCRPDLFEGPHGSLAK